MLIFADNFESFEYFCDRLAYVLGAIATLDSDFNIYRRYRKKPFERVFLPS